MKIFTKSTFLLFLITATFSLSSNAVIDYKPDTDKKTTIVKKHKKAKKKGLFKRWKEKLILKKLKKLQKKTDTNSPSKEAGLSIGAGLVSGLMWGLLFLSEKYFMILLAGMFAIIGILISLKVLRKTRDSKEHYKKERLMAKLGLTLSVLAGLPVLGFLALVIFYSVY